jgi:ABC-type polar amino acid transport system ATPase subunit
MLSARNVTKSFGAAEVLCGVDLTLEPGQITCVIGPSGTGKTTLLRALSLIDEPDGGQVEIDGQSYTFPTPRPISAKPWPHVTAVFQSLFLWPHLTLRENIMLPARNVNPAAEKDIEGLIKLFEMEHFIDSYPNEASVGQRQRVAVARALMLNPRYILMDEITSALDVEQTARILTKLTHLREREIGVMIITHALGFARRAADQVVFMDDGKVAEAGGPAILDSPESPRLKEFLSMAELAA